MKSLDTAVSARIIFMVADLTAFISILVGMNHASIETAHVTLSPIQLRVPTLTHMCRLNSEDFSKS